MSSVCPEQRKGQDPSDPGLWLSNNLFESDPLLFGSSCQYRFCKRLHRLVSDVVTSSRYGLRSFAIFIWALERAILPFRSYVITPHICMYSWSDQFITSSLCRFRVSRVLNLSVQTGPEDGSSKRPCFSRYYSIDLCQKKCVCAYYWRMSSSGMWHRVELVWTDVSEERTASTFRLLLLLLAVILLGHAVA
jgi:hypothetical protein